jgi:hypothetical protein
MCPYYLDGDLTEPVGSVGDTRCHRGLSLRGGCGYCAVFKGRREGAGPADRHEGRPASTGLSKLNSMHGLELGEVPRGARGAAVVRRCGRRLGRPGPVDVLAVRSVAAVPPAVARRPYGFTDGAVSHVPLREGLPRKEVIQPHLPVRLPCYDFTPVTSPTFDGSLPQGVRPPASGVAHSRGVTGGVYKARERIHRGSADPRLLATPPSCRRVSACNPNRDAL